MRLGAIGIRVLAAALLGLGLTAVAAAVQGQQRYEDGSPSGIPPGFEPVDISGDMEQIDNRRQREMDQQVDREMYQRYDTPERRIRARYGGATWNMYDPFH
jgi:hypothetical protein